MSNFWKKLMGRRDHAAGHRAEAQQFESRAERDLAAEGVEGVVADEVVEERFGVDAERLVDDEFKP